MGPHHCHSHKTLLHSHTNTCIQRHDLYTNCLNRMCNTFPAPCLLIGRVYMHNVSFPASKLNVEGFGNDVLNSSLFSTKPAWARCARAHVCLCVCVCVRARVPICSLLNPIKWQCKWAASASFRWSPGRFHFTNNRAKWRPTHASLPQHREELGYRGENTKRGLLPARTYVASTAIGGDVRR